MDGDLKNRLRDRLRHARMTQAQLAVALDIGNPQNISHWYSRGGIPHKWLYRVAEMLECDPDWLQTGKGDAKRQDVAEVVAVDPDVLAKILDRTLHAIGAAGLDWTPKQVAGLVSQLYQLYQLTGEYPASYEMAVQLSELKQA